MWFVRAALALSAAACYDPALVPPVDLDDFEPAGPEERAPQTGAGSPDATCPDRYVSSPAGSCYRVVPVPQTWVMAEHDCEDDVAAEPRPHLVVLDDLEEGIAVYQMLSEDQWLGLRQVGLEWGWISAVPLSFSNWDSDEPSGEGSCAELKLDVGTYWDDESCDEVSERRPYVCEHDGVPPAP